MAWAHTLLTTSGRPFSPSQTTKKLSLIPRFLRSVSTAIQLFWCACQAVSADFLTRLSSPTGRRAW
jgi:hypothetical protein